MYVETYYKPITAEVEETAHDNLADAIAKMQAKLALAERLVLILNPIAHHAQANAKMCKLALAAGLRSWSGDYYGRNRFCFSDRENDTDVQITLDKGASMADALKALTLMESERAQLAAMIKQITHLSEIRETELTIRKLAAEIDSLRDKIKGEVGYFHDSIQGIFVGVCKTSR